MTQANVVNSVGSAKQATNPTLTDDTLGGYCYTAKATDSNLEAYNFISLDPTHAAHTMQQARDRTGPHRGTILVAMDSGATCGVVESAELCVDIKSVKTTVKVGGDGKPHFVQVRKQGILPIDQFIY